jgi:CheY-like chemotaxis protein
MVDDDLNVLRSLMRLFMDCTDVEIITSSSPAEALQLFESEGPFDIVLSDYMMPVMNGIDLIARIRSRWPDTVGIILSGYADMEQITKALAEGQIRHYVTKPWDSEELVALVNNESRTVSTGRKGHGQ